MTNDTYNKLIAQSVPDAETAFGMMDKLLDVANPEAVYSKPVTADGVTVITASEYVGGLGVGFGGGFGPAMDETGEGQPVGAGGGGGAGGGILSRPVAAIIVENGHARVEPIVDATKIAIALFTTIGAMAMAFSRMWRRSR